MDKIISIPDYFVLFNCILWSYDRVITENVGTRHRAAIGMSENSDALVLVVSEETGTVSIAKDGKLERGFNSRTLHKYLMNAFVGDASSGLSGFFNKKGDGNAKSK